MMNRSKNAVIFTPMIAGLPVHRDQRPVLTGIYRTSGL